MPTPFTPTAHDELARRLARRRASIEQIVRTSRRGLAIEDRDVSDFLGIEGPDAGTDEFDRSRPLELAALAAPNLDGIEQALSLIEDQELIARDLYDAVIEDLFSVGLSLQVALPLVADDRASDRIVTAIEQLDQTVGRVRSVVFGMQRPGAAT
ncbi:MAG: histidine kinase [Acidimicrobiales bacterium]